MKRRHIIIFGSLTMVVVFILNFTITTFGFSYYRSDSIFKEEEFNYDVLYHDASITEEESYEIVESMKGEVIPIVDENAFFSMPCEGSYSTSIYFVEKELIISPRSSAYAKYGEKVKIFDDNIVFKVQEMIETGYLGKEASPNNLLYMVQVYDMDSEKVENRKFRLQIPEIKDTKSSYVIKQWKLDSKGWWLSNSDGSFETGWVEMNKVWYLLGEDGYMKTGWQCVYGKWYYLDKSGIMLMNAITPDGFKVGGDGARISSGR